MQLAELDRDVQSAGIAKQSTMSIQMDGTAFKILSDGLYQNKIGSIVRETYSNVLDSHIAAGKQDTPGYIKLPNALDPTFKVRDEGIGLDEQGVMEVATTYFSSTKRTSNDAVGGFGLGFKSPFAYTDQWTIVAIKDGIKRTFSAYMDPNGMPQVAMLASEETDDVNGVEVSIPVNLEDCTRFATEVAEQLSYFDPRPIITGGQVEWPEREVVLSGDGWAVYKSKWGFRYETDWYAKIGPVAYEIDKSELGWGPLSAFMECSGIIEFEVGDITPTPSREGLQYTPDAVALLNKRFEAIKEHIAPSAAKEISKCSTYWEAVKTFRPIHRSLGFGLRDCLDGLNYEGEEIVSAIDVNLWNKDSSKLEEGSIFEITDYHNASGDKTRLRKNQTSLWVAPSDTLTIYVDDLPSSRQRQAARIDEHVKDIGRRDGVLFRDMKYERVLELLKGVPEDQVVRLSEIEPPVLDPKHPKAKRKPVTVKSVSASAHIHSKVVDNLFETEDDPKEGLYVVTSQGYIRHSDMLLLKSIEYFSDTKRIYCVPKSLESRFEKNDKFMLVSDAWEEYFEDNKSKVLKSLKKEALCDSIWNLPHGDFFRSVLTAEQVSIPARSKNPFWKIAKIFEETKESKYDISPPYLACEHLLEYYSEQKKDFELKYRELASEFEEKHSELNCLLNGLTHGSRHHEPIVTLICQKLTK